MLSEFRNHSANRLDIHQLVELAAFGRALRAEYEAMNLEVPDWVDNQLKAIRREVRAKNADKLEMRRRELSNKLESLKTPAERKQAIKAELKELEKALTAEG